MRKSFVCAQMIALALLLISCGEQAPTPSPFETMDCCTMEAVVRNTYRESLRSYRLRCDWTQAQSTVTVLEPEALAGVEARVEGEKMSLCYDGGVCLDSGSTEGLSPATALPALMRALRSGYLLEENREKWGETDCRRQSFESSGSNGEKLLYTVWLDAEKGTPLRAEIVAKDEIIFRVEFTSFQFGDRIA